jgi:hypothetical protein
MEGQCSGGTGDVILGGEINRGQNEIGGGERRGHFSGAEIRGAVFVIIFVLENGIEHTPRRNRMDGKICRIKIHVSLDPIYGLIITLNLYIDGQTLTGFRRQG